MDINSLLSPQDAPPRPAPPSANPAPKKRGRPAGGKRTSSALSQEITISPDPPEHPHEPPREPPRSAPRLSHEAVAQAQQQALRPSLPSAYSFTSDVRTPYSNIDTPSSEGRSPFGTPQLNRTIAANFRPSPTPQMETLAGESSHTRIAESSELMPLQI